MSFCKERIAEFRLNFLDVTPSSMRNRIEYLVKYSIAPPPSRDYYGLKIFEDEVILYLWKISHGPHKAPIVYRAKLNKFDEDKSLQNEIRHGFGKHLLKYVKNIAKENRNLLTLPNSVIGKISKYLEFTDILKLSSLSRIAYEVFNTDLVWQILYTRDKKANISLEKKEKIIIYDWKQLYKDKEMQTSIKDQTNHRISSLVINHSKTNKLLIKSISDAPKSTSNKTSTTKKRLDDPSVMALVTIPLSKTMSDTRFCTYTNKDEKPFLQKKNIKNTSSTFNINEKNVKKDLIMSKMTTKQEIRSVSKRNKISDKQINQTMKSNSGKYLNKINTKPTTSTQESKLKCKTQTASKTPVQTASKTSISKNIVGNIKSSSVSIQNLQNKIQSQAKSKPKKKVIATKSKTFNTDEELSENPFTVRYDKVDLADLIEASLKKIRSPRNIFDYDFSCVEQPNRTKDILDIRNEIQNIDKSKQLKLTKNSVNTNNFSHKIIQNNEILEKLSEKSEMFDELSNESLDKKFLSKEDNKPISEKYMKAREELRKSLEWNRSDPVSSQDRWDPDINFQNKSYIYPKKVVNNNEKSPIPKRPLKTSSLKAYLSNSLEKEIKF
ncbi:F-box only protein 36 [Trachymyrmex septentrionalis]|uniref:F-box only protein 36 n=2 Tax=Trachymyrmex septentrionalis TaxID=34720 RepID=A0A195FIG4_9HYME|nr:F-box only protein 36 [Trachymyrmex septentrionalis]